MCTIGLQSSDKNTMQNTDDNDFIENGACMMKINKDDRGAATSSKTIRAKLVYSFTTISMCILLLVLRSNDKNHFSVRRRLKSKLDVEIENRSRSLYFAEDPKTIWEKNGYESISALPDQEILSGTEGNDPHICTLVSAKKDHGMQLTALISSLLSSHYCNIDIMLLNTEEIETSTSYLNEVANVFNTHKDRCSSRPNVHVSELNQEHVRLAFPNLRVVNDYGFLLIDIVINHLQLNKISSIAPCDYFLITNGDALYSSKLIPTTLPKMRESMDLIGFEYLSQSVKNGTEQGIAGIPQQVIHTRFETHSIDKSAAFFRSSTIRKSGINFALNHARETNDLTRETLECDVELLGGNFFEKLSKLPNVTSTIINQVLMMHL